jgi:hypothetical protein
VRRASTREGSASLGQIHVLDRYRHAINQALWQPLLPSLLCGLGRFQRTVSIDQTECSHLTVKVIDSFQHILGGLNRGQLTSTVGGHKLGRSEVGGRAHECSLS